jgi:proteasome assembly chaperone (PAC2) family protein
LRTSYIGATNEDQNERSRGVRKPETVEQHRQLVVPRGRHAGAGLRSAGEPLRGYLTGASTFRHPSIFTVGGFSIGDIRRQLSVRHARFLQEHKMQIKTNVRAGKGGASGVGKNSPGSPDVPVYYVPPVSRCAGI